VPVGEAPEEPGVPAPPVSLGVQPRLVVPSPLARCAPRALAPCAGPCVAVLEPCPADVAPRANPRLKSPGAALGLSLGLYLGPLTLGSALFFGGMRSDGAMIAGLTFGAFGAIVGPSIGQFYAGNVARGIGTLLARGFLVPLSTYLIVGGFFNQSQAGLGAGIALAGGAFALALWDIIDAPLAVRRANAAALAVTPIVARDRAGAALCGVAVGGRF
jgi:hypothetical protein